MGSNRARRTEVHIADPNYFTSSCLKQICILLTIWQSRIIEAKTINVSFATLSIGDLTETTLPVLVKKRFVCKTLI